MSWIIKVIILSGAQKIAVKQPDFTDNLLEIGVQNTFTFDKSLHYFE